MYMNPQVLIVSEDEERYYSFRNLLGAERADINILRTDTIGEACSIIQQSGVDALVIDPSALVATAAVRPKIEKHNRTKGNIRKDIIFVRKFIFRHYSEKITLRLLADMVSLTPNYLSVEFHRCEGITIMEFIETVRLERAAALLGGSKLNVNVIARAVGFPNTSYFCSRFRRVYNMSPRKYRSERMVEMREKREKNGRRDKM